MESEKAAMIISPYALPVHAKKPAELPEYRGEGNACIFCSSILKSFMTAVLVFGV